MKIAIIGLGYVGLPLAITLSKEFDITGFDISLKKIESVRNEFKDIPIKFTNLQHQLDNQDIYIICVPTPVTKDNLPDMSCLKEASELVGKSLSKGSIVIYESTVYPGATEEYCVPILESESGLIFNKDFSVGYSPERIDPGNKINTLHNTTKLVSASNNKALETIVQVYSSVVTKAPLFICESIKVCEAAKAIENIQRDVNIALMNELSIIFNKLNIPIRSVINAASTKWNFGKYHPGLVGGHCIGVDPYYLIYRSEQAGVEAKIIKSSREINDGMVDFCLVNILNDVDRRNLPSNFCDLNILFLGITFKENCEDCRNSQPLKLLSKLANLNQNISVYDPFVKDFDLEIKFPEGLIFLSEFPDDLTSYNLIVKAVNHDAFQDKIIKTEHSKFFIIDLVNSLNSDGFSLY